MVVMDTVYTSETSVSVYETTWLNIPEASLIYICHRDNLKSHSEVELLKKLNERVAGITE
jgi:hypothetical protein